MLATFRQRASLLGLALGVLIAIVAAGSARAALVSASDGNLAAFTGGVSQVNGTLTTVPNRYGADGETFAAQYAGTGASGAASGSFNVHWTQGQTAVYGAAFYLPTDYHAASSGQQGLITWDNSPGTGGTIVQGGVIVDYSDNSGYLVTTTISGTNVTSQVLAGPFPLPIGRWFTLDVRQILGSGASAYNEVDENGQAIASSQTPNFSGPPITQISYGIVELSVSAEQGPVLLDFDQASASNSTTSSRRYVNPLSGDRYFTERTDMGVDFCLTPGEPIRALGDAVVAGVSPDWFDFEPYIWYRLLDGPDAGRYVYVAEQITRLAHVGAHLSAGQPVAFYKRTGTCIETGWSAPDGATLAQVTTGYTEGQITVAGVSFARFLISLGVRGRFELKPSPVKARRKPLYRRSRLPSKT